MFGVNDSGYAGRDRPWCKLCLLGALSFALADADDSARWPDRKTEACVSIFGHRGPKPFPCLQQQGRILAPMRMWYRVVGAARRLATAPGLLPIGGRLACGQPA